MYRNTLAVTKKGKAYQKYHLKRQRKLIFDTKKRNWIELSLPKKRKGFISNRKDTKKKEINFKLHWPNHY